MKKINIIITVTAVALIFLGVDDILARGGGHGGGGRGGGGWSGGRGGGERWHGGDEHREGRHGENGEYHHGEWDHHPVNPDHHPVDPNRDYNRTVNRTVNYNGDGRWGWGWGAADSAIAGMAVGAAIANSSPTTVVVEQPETTVVQEPDQSSSDSEDYGTQVTVLPAGAEARNVNGQMAYQCGSTWYRPFFGSNGVYYEVMPPPPDSQ